MSELQDKRARLCSASPESTADGHSERVEVQRLSTAQLMAQRTAALMSRPEWPSSSRRGVAGLRFDSSPAPVLSTSQKNESASRSSTQCCTPKSSTAMPPWMTPLCTNQLKAPATEQSTMQKWIVLQQLQSQNLNSRCPSSVSVSTSERSTSSSTTGRFPLALLSSVQDSNAKVKPSRDDDLQSICSDVPLFDLDGEDVNEENEDENKHRNALVVAPQINDAMKEQRNTTNLYSGAYFFPDGYGDESIYNRTSLMAARLYICKNNYGCKVGDCASKLDTIDVRKLREDARIFIRSTKISQAQFMTDKILGAYDASCSKFRCMQVHLDAVTTVELCITSWALACGFSSSMLQSVTAKIKMGEVLDRTEHFLFQNKTIKNKAERRSMDFTQLRAFSHQACTSSRMSH